MQSVVNGCWLWFGSRGGLSLSLRGGTTPALSEVEWVAIVVIRCGRLALVDRRREPVTSVG